MSADVEVIGLVGAAGGDKVQDGGGVVCRRGDVYALEYWQIAVGKPRRLRVFRVELPLGLRDIVASVAPGELKEISRAAQTTPVAFGRMASNSDPMVRASLVESLGNYLGWRRFDPKPVTVSAAQLVSRWERAVGRGPRGTT